jgi:NADPH:quinone reductase-like Zn-dependent oxidoreductase
MNYGGTITCCGLVAGPNFDTTVFPFILRGNSLIGIDSATTPIKEKSKIWKLFACDWKLDNLDSLHKTIDMQGMMGEIKKILKGSQVGRVVLKHN